MLIFRAKKAKSTLYSSLSSSGEACNSNGNRVNKASRDNENRDSESRDNKASREDERIYNR